MEGLTCLLYKCWRRYDKSWILGNRSWRAIIVLVSSW